MTVSSHPLTNLGDKVILAPMVRGSEQAFRALVRNHGVSRCYGPMLRAAQVIKAHNIWKASTSMSTRTSDSDADSSSSSSLSSLVTHEDGQLLLWDFSRADDDRELNLTVQLCGRCPTTLEAATGAVLDIFADGHDKNPLLLEGIDLNLGCPQKCAQSGGFGAFLVEQDPDLAIQCVAAMKRVLDNHAQGNHDHSNASSKRRPRLSCKVRLLDRDEDTIAFCRRLEAAGCELLAIHCRRRSDPPDGCPDWSMGKKLVDSLSIPVVMNGGIKSREDILSVLDATGAHAVMIAQGFLDNPYLLEVNNQHETTIDPAVMAAEYLEFVDKYPPPSCLFIARHFRWFFRSQLQPQTRRKEEFQSWRARLWTFLVRPYLQTVYQFRQVVVMYVYQSGAKMPPSLRHIPEPTFSSIRHGRSGSDNGSTCAIDLALGRDNENEAGCDGPLIPFQ
jgi:tRNA-dihydrouridine synthase